MIGPKERRRRGSMRARVSLTSGSGGALAVVLRGGRTNASPWPPPRALRGLVAAVALTLAALASPGSALAGDGTDGRLEGDLDLSAGAGAAITATAPALALRVAATYVSMAGVYAGYADTLGAGGAPFARAIAAGITLKPVFWARFAYVVETGSPRLDLFLDSFVFEIGPVWSAPPGRGIATAPGLEIAAGVGFPILASATGPFVELRGALRYRKEDLDGSVRSDFGERGAIVSLALSWHHVVNAHIADAGDRVVR